MIISVFEVTTNRNAYYIFVGLNTRVSDSYLQCSRRGKCGNHILKLSLTPTTRQSF